MMNDDDTKKDSSGDVPYEEEQGTMMDIDLKKLGLDDPKKPAAADDEDEPTQALSVDEMLKKQKSLLNRLGIKKLFKKD